MALKILRNSEGGCGHRCNVSSVICHGDLIVTGGDDGNIKIWKSDLELVAEMASEGGILSMAACDNLLYTCSSDESIRSWDLNGGKLTGTLPSTLYQPQRLYVDQASKVLWAGDSQGNVAKFIDGKEAAKFELMEEIWDLIVRGNSVFTARDRDVVIAEIISGTQRTRAVIKITHRGRSPMCISEKYFCFLTRDGRNICVCENSMADKFPVSHEIGASDLIINALASPVENSLYSGGYDSTVKKWDLPSSNCLGSANLGCCINALACPTENEVYVARSDGVVTKLGL